MLSMLLGDWFEREGHLKFLKSCFQGILTNFLLARRNSLSCGTCGKNHILTSYIQADASTVGHFSRPAFMNVSIHVFDVLLKIEAFREKKYYLPVTGSRFLSIRCYYLDRTAHNYVKVRKRKKADIRQIISGTEVLFIFVLPCLLVHSTR